MLNSKFLLTTVLCGGLFFAGNAVTAYGASGTARLIEPNSGWAVSKLAAAQTGGQAYCALARRFTNDFVLTLARNAKDESSIAIDFQKQALQNSQTYYVSLKPGFGQDRAFNVRPVSGKALVIRLGQDYAFHDALNRSGKLEVDISGEIYAFNLPDFSEGQKKLGTCLSQIEGTDGGASRKAAVDSDLIPPPPAARSALVPNSETAPVPTQESPIIKASAKSQTSSPPVASAVIPVTAQAQTQPDIVAARLTKEVDDLQEENMRLRGALERERRNYEDRFMQESQNSSVAAELKEKVRLLEEENKKLHNQTAFDASGVPSCPAVSTSASSAGTDEALKAQLAQLQEENSRLRKGASVAEELQRQLSDSMAENVRLKTSGNVSDALKQQIEVLQAENQKLRGSSTAAASSLEQELSGLREENLKLKQELAAQQARSDMLGKQLASSKGSGAAGQDVVDSLNERVARLQEENARLRKQSEMMTKDGAAVPVSLAQLRSVEEQLRYVEKDRDALAQKVEELSQAQRDGRLDISSDNWDLEQATRRYNEAEREIQRLSRQIQDQQTQCAANAKKLEYMLFDPQVAEKEQIAKLMKLEQEVNSAQDSMDDQRAVYESRISALEKESADRKSAVDIIRTEYEQKLAVLKKEIGSSTGDASASQRIASLENELSALKEKSAADQATLQIQKAEYEQKLALLQQEMQTRGNGMQEARARIAHLEQELLDKGTLSADSQARIASLESELQNRKVVVQQAQERIAALESQVQEKTKAAIDAQGRVAALETEIAASRELSKKAEERVASLEADLQSIRSSSSSTTSEIMAMQKQKEDIRRQKEAVEAQNKALSAHIVSLESQLVEVRTAASETTQQIDARVDALMKEKVALTQQRDSLIEQKKLVVADNDRLNTMVSGLENQLAQIQTAAGESADDFDGRVASLKKERDDLVNKQIKLEAENDRLSGLVAALEDNLEKLKGAQGEADKINETVASLRKDNKHLVQERDRLSAERKLLEDRLSSVEQTLSFIETSSGGPASVKMTDKKGTTQADEVYQSFGESVQKTVEPVVSTSRSRMTASALQSILEQARIEINGGIQTVGEEGSTDLASYSWDTGNLYGSAEQQPISNLAQFGKMVDGYLEKTRARCQGDFAAVPVMTENQGDMRVSAYEIACVQGNDGASASVVFYNNRDVFTAIAHETGLDQMDVAMDVRDRLVRSIVQNQIVSR